MWPFDDVLAALNYGFDFLLGLLYLLVYLPYAVCVVLLNQIIYMANLLISLVNAIESVVIHISTAIAAVFEPLMFDSIVSWILFAQIAVMILWFVYDRLKGVSIAGFSL